MKTNKNIGLGILSIGLIWLSALGISVVIATLFYGEMFWLQVIIISPFTFFATIATKVLYIVLIKK